MEEKYLKFKAAHEAKLTVKERQSKALGYLKLLLVIGGIAILCAIIARGAGTVKIALLAADIILSVWLWIKHSGLCREIDYIKGMIAVNRRYIDRIDGTWIQFPDDGAEYMNYDHPYSNDLDIFGSKSIFQFLNATNTAGGRARLMSDLSQPEYDHGEIKRRQSAIAELSKLDEFTGELQCRGGFIADRDSIETLSERVKDKTPFIKNDLPKLIFRYMPRIFCPVAVCIFAFKLSWLYPTGLVLLGVQLVLWLVFSGRANRYLRDIGKIKHGLEKYSEIFELLEGQEFESELLCEIREGLTQSGHSASLAIKKLDGIMQRVEVRSNPLLFFVLNILLLWDIGCCMSLEQWRSTYSRYFDTWIGRLGEIESMVSFSVISNVVSQTVYPELSREKNVLRVKSLGHPLISNDRRIGNDFNLADDIVIISGSNMSGKTTFLRTVGLNMVLAKCGSPVCADEMQFSNMLIATSMRITDDLNEGISTFYAELQKVKTIITMAQEKRNLLFLIDEIFRGTNSADRMAGAWAVISKLHRSGVCGLLTTHDLAMCEYTDDASIVNYHFSEQYRDGRLSFDYKIMPGIAKSTNGQFLMKMVGIMD